MRVGTPIVTDKRTGQAYTTGTVQGAMDLANNLSAGGAPGMPARSGTYTGSVAGQQSYATQGGGQGISFGTKTYKPGVVPGSPTFQANPVQPGMNNPKNVVQGPQQPAQAPGIMNQVSSSVSANMTAPGIKQVDVQGMKDRAADNVTKQAVGQKAAASSYLRAAGFGNSGDKVGAMVDIDTNAAANRNRMGRDIELDAARTNAQMQSTATGQGLQLAGMQQSANERALDRASEEQRYQDSLLMKQGRYPGQPEFDFGGFSVNKGRSGVAGGANATSDGWTLNKMRGGVAPGF